MKLRKLLMNTGFVLAALFALIPFVSGDMTHQMSLSDPDCVPEGATIESATLSLVVATGGNQTVNVHRITAPWAETVVTWNSFGGAYDMAVEGSFVTDGSYQWRSVDVTALVQAWVDGTHPNYGMLLEQGQTQHSTYRSSEYPYAQYRPMLEICYTGSGGTVCVTIQRPGAEQDGVADSYIWELLPDLNAGTSVTLFTGLVNDYEKQSLLWFDFICEECVDPHTHGYWKNHPDAWPVTSLMLGSETYDMTELMALLWSKVKGDASKILAIQLISAKLSIANGSPPDPVNAAIAGADALLSTFSGKLPYGVHPDTVMGQAMVDYADILDQYNNGELTDCD